jgi:hypothetical protein
LQSNVNGNGAVVLLAAVVLLGEKDARSKKQERYYSCVECALRDNGSGPAKIGAVNDAPSK